MLPTRDRTGPAPDQDPKSAADSSLVHRTDLVLTAIILAGCGALYYMTTTFEEVSLLLAQNISPEFFPRLLLWLIVVLAVFLPVEHRFLEKGRQGLDKGRRERIKAKTVVTAGLLGGTVASMPWLGTYFSMILVCLLLPLLWGERRLKVVLPFAILFPTAVALLFTQVLRVYFEPGIVGPVFH